MGIHSAIEWTDHTFNPWWGCIKVSEGCANCYAETWAKRYGHDLWGRNKPRRFFGENHWKQPIKWNKHAIAKNSRHTPEKKCYGFFLAPIGPSIIRYSPGGWIN